MTIDFENPAGHPLDDDGIWAEIRNPHLPAGATPLFLDRDGVIVEEVHYLHKPEDVALTPGAAAVIRSARESGLAVVIVTNQAGIGYGKYGWDDFAAVQTKMFDDLAAEGADVDAVFACPFHKTGIAPWNHPDHPARKPNPGMLLKARDQLGLNMTEGWIVGDRAGDLEAGLRAGLCGGLQVLTGHGSRDGERETSKALATESYDVRVGRDIRDALGLPLLNRAPR